MGETAYAAIIRGHLADVFQGDTAILASYPGIRLTSDGFELLSLIHISEPTRPKR